MLEGKEKTCRILFAALRHHQWRICHALVICECLFRQIPSNVTLTEGEALFSVSSFRRVITADRASRLHQISLDHCPSPRSPPAPQRHSSWTCTVRCSSHGSPKCSWSWFRSLFSFFLTPGMKVIEGEDRFICSSSAKLIHCRSVTDAQGRHLVLRNLSAPECKTQAEVEGKSIRRFSCLLNCS